ncbi:MAG: hypothetical protein WC529_04045 [Candidatus Margulisiibacteriota bacterium]
MPTVERLGRIKAFLQRAGGQAEKRLALGRLAALPYDETRPLELRRAARDLTVFTAEHLQLEKLDPVSVADQAVVELEQLRQEAEVLRLELDQAKTKLNRLERYWEGFDPVLVDTMRLMMQQLINNVRSDPKLAEAMKPDMIRNIMFTAYVALDKAYKAHQPEEADVILRDLRAFFDFHGLTIEQIDELLDHRERIASLSGLEPAEANQLLFEFGIFFNRFFDLQPEQREWLFSTLKKTELQDEEIAKLPFPEQLAALSYPLSADVRQQAIGRMALLHPHEILDAVYSPCEPVSNAAWTVLTKRLHLWLEEIARGDSDLDKLKAEIRSFSPVEIGYVRELLQERIVKSPDEKPEIVNLANQLLGTIKKSWLGKWKIS